MDSRKSRCKKVHEEGKNKGKRCRNNATVDGLCKIHSTAKNGVEEQPSFESDKLGIERYRDLRKFIGGTPLAEGHQEAPSSPSVPLFSWEEYSTSSVAPRASYDPEVPPPETRQDLRTDHLSLPQQTSLEESESSSSDDDDQSPPSSHRLPPSPLSLPSLSLSPSRFSSRCTSSSQPSVVNNKSTGKKRRAKSAGSDKSTDFDAKYICVMGVSEIAKMIERTTPKLDGFRDALFKNEVWTNSLDVYLDSKPEVLSHISPEWALVGSTLFVGLSVASANAGYIEHLKTHNNQKSSENRDYSTEDELAGYTAV